MDARPYLSLGGDPSPVDLNDLDDDIRRGRVPPAAKLRYPPWTGERFVPLGEIPALAEALDSPGARLAQHFRTGPFPRLSTALSLLLIVAAVLQAAASLISLGPLSEPLLRFFYVESAVGYEPLLLDGRWWSPLTSQLVHDGPEHFLPNLAVLGYTGYRVERALGSGFAVVAAASLLVPALLVSLLTPAPVVGSSLLGYGLFGAMLSIGFRFGDSIPEGWRRSYGFSNLWLFALLFISSLGGENTSHWGHIGGFIGGGLAGFFVPSEVLAGRARAQQVRWRNLGVAAALAAAPGLLGLALGHVPLLAFGAPQPVELVNQGISLEVPARLMVEAEDKRLPVLPGQPEPEFIPYTRTVSGLPAWSTSPDSPQLVFAGRSRVRGEPPGWEDRGETWRRTLGGQLAEAAAPAPKGEGWTAHALELDGVEALGDVSVRVVEHHKLEGQWLARLGYVVVLRGGEPGPRGEAFRAVLDSATLGEIPAVVKAREDHERNPRSAKLALEYARQLSFAGRLEEADAIWAAQIEAGGGKVGEAVAWRLSTWADHPERFDAPEPAWFEPWLTQQVYLGDGLRWLVARGRCEAARGHLEALEEPPEAFVALVATCGS
jgi:rhomboid protease GluP